MNPRLDKLFHVLVILGGAAGLAACAEDGSSRRDTPAPDAAAADDAAVTDDGSPGVDGGAVCFCNIDPCCDRSTDPPTVEDGFSCCWSTTCE